MKSNNRNISLVLVVVLAISVLSACAPKVDEPVGTEVLLQNVGFVEAKISKDGKNFIEIDTNGDKLDLEITDQKIYDNIGEKDFYIFAYNEDKVLKSINKSPYLEDLIENSTEPDDKPEGREISPVDKIAVEDLTLLDKYEFDFKGNNVMGNINTYTNAGRDANGEIMWDDGQRWVIVVHSEDKDYVLFDDYVQLGQINSYVYTIEDDFYIATLSTGTANLTLKSYLYDKDKDMFIETIPFNTEGNVNMGHSTFGY